MALLTTMRKCACTIQRASTNSSAARIPSLEDLVHVAAHKALHFALLNRPGFGGR